MRPRKLVMENVGPFSGRVELDFSALGDIFLISGKTGSGKTTIFDSICYALYGTLPGSREGFTGRLRSDFAPEDVECSVSLEFELGDRAFRIDRSPKQEKRKKRGSGMTTSEETAALYELTPTGSVALSGKKTEADERVRSLLGLSDKEFSKIVLLPQGEFADFLRQNTTERREVLRKLFPVDLAVRVRELANEKANTAKARLLEAERNLAEKTARFSVDGYEAARKEAGRSLEQAKAESQRLEAEAGRLGEALRDAEAEAEADRRLASAVEEEKAIAAAAGEIEAKEAALGASRTARPLEGLLSREEEAEGAAKRAEQAAAEAAVRAASCRRALAEAEARRPEIQAAEAEAASLRTKRFPLAEAALAEEELARDGSELVRLDRSREELALRIEAAKTAVAARTGEIAALREKAERVEELDATWETAREAMERAKAAKNAADRAERPAKEHAAALERATRLAKECAELERNIPVLEAELAEKEATKKETELAGSAALLASELRKGEPCPVCGSREHPAPAAARPLSYGLAERIEALKKFREDAVRRLSAGRADQASADREVKRTERELAEARADYAREAGLEPEETATADWTPSGTAAAAELQARVDELNAIVASRREAQNARTRIDVLRREADEANRAKGELDIELGRLAEKRAALEATVAQRKARAAEAIAAIDLGAGGAGPQDARDALAAVDKALQTLDASIAARKTELENAGREVAAADAHESAAAALAKDAEQLHRRSSDALQAALAQSPFSDLDSLRAALMDAETEAAAERRIAEWKEQRARAHAVRAELERALAELRSGRVDRTASAEELSLALEALKAQRETAATQRDEAAAALADIEKEKAAHEEAETRRRTLAGEASRLKALSDDLSGANPKKRAFDSWILGLYLAEVAAYATKRLERMSEGRFSLLLDVEGDGGRGKTGLDLAVFDAYTGRSRPCATLSGGESFMASISLALGLADSIQARSGGVRLDAVFIDEGFGSLDEASLDKALGILDEIRDHRMVGLISHVGEMRSRIPSRVEVVKSGVGSRIRIESGT